MNYVQHHNLEECCNRCFWVGAGLAFIVLVGGLAMCAMFVATKDVEAQELGAGPEHVEPVSGRAWIFEQATKVALETISDTELKCQVSEYPIAHCEQELPQWKRLTGVAVVPR